MNHLQMINCLPAKPYPVGKMEDVIKFARENFPAENDLVSVDEMSQYLHKVLLDRMNNGADDKTQMEDAEFYRYLKQTIKYLREVEIEKMSSYKVIGGKNPGAPELAEAI